MGKPPKVWSVLCVLLFGATLTGCVSTGPRPAVTGGECQYFDNGGGLVLVAASGLREGEVVNIGLYDPKIPEARDMVERAELSAATKAKLGLPADRHALPRNPGDPLHANLYVWRRWAHRILWAIPDPRQSRVWFGIGTIDGAVVVDNDPDDGIAALGYCLSGTEKGPDGLKHRGHAPRSPARRFQPPATVARK